MSALLQDHSYKHQTPYKKINMNKKKAGSKTSHTHRPAEYMTRTIAPDHTENKFKNVNKNREHTI
jgi:hypothetical protein